MLRFRGGSYVLASATVVVLLGGWPTARAGGYLQEAPPITYRGFTLVSGRCLDSEPACALREPKAWSQSDLETVKQAIDAVLLHPKGQDIVARTRQRGFATLRRYAAGLHDSKPVAAIAAVLQRGSVSDGIDLHDRFFEDAGARDTYSGTPGYLYTAQALLHECMHAVDDQPVRPQLLKQVGFVQTGQRWRFAVTESADAAVMAEFGREVARFEQAADLASVRRLNRRLALEMRPVRMPTMQSARSPAEAFAEIGSHLILDPGARNYLPRSIVAYFDAQVFAGPVK